MDIKKIKRFFMWCTIINGVLLFLSIIGCILFTDLIYRVQGNLFHITRENFNVIFYSFLGLFKIFWLTFNVTPYISLSIIDDK
jgi:hypothetical protein